MVTIVITIRIPTRIMMTKRVSGPSSGSTLYSCGSEEAALGSRLPGDARKVGEIDIHSEPTSSHWSAHGSKWRAFASYYMRAVHRVESTSALPLHWWRTPFVNVAWTGADTRPDRRRAAPHRDQSHPIACRVSQTRDVRARLVSTAQGPVRIARVACRLCRPGGGARPSLRSAHVIIPSVHRQQSSYVTGRWSPCVIPAVTC